MALTKHQTEKLSESLEILSGGKRLLLKGSAGVGKTYMSDELIRYLSESMNLYYSTQIYCSAPTNKAVGVLKGKVTQDVTFITAHSALKMKRKISKTGKKSFMPDFHEKYPPLKGVKLFVIDEASMIQLDLLIYIEEHAIKNNCTVIFIGDDKQINPVGETDSPVFLGKPILISKETETPDGTVGRKQYDEDYDVVFRPYPEVELTEIVRQKNGNPIIDLSRNLEAIAYKQDNRTEIGGYIYTYDEDKIIQTLADVNGTDKLKYLSWSNSDVDRINHKVRQRIYGTPHKIQQGETIVFDEPFKDYFTNEEVYVDKLLVREKEIVYDKEEIFGREQEQGRFTIKYYSINYKESTDWMNNDKKEITDDIMVVHEDSEREFEEAAKYIKGCAMRGTLRWIYYFEFIEQFAQIKYNHALTIHKSQGSTFEKAIINVKNINFNSNIIERNRLMYTAVTRASDLLILYNA